jgi:hypothetical protein
MAIRDRAHNAKVYEQNRLDAIQKTEKRICNYGCIFGSVMQQPSVAYAIHDVYMTIMSIPWYGLPHGCLESRIG